MPFKQLMFKHTQEAHKRIPNYSLRSTSSTAQLTFSFLFLFPIHFRLASLIHRNSTHKEKQNDSDKLKRDQLLNEIETMRAKEKDLLEFVKQNEALDPDKAVKLKRDAKV